MLSPCERSLAMSFLRLGKLADGNVTIRVASATPVATVTEARDGRTETLANSLIESPRVVKASFTFPGAYCEANCGTALLKTIGRVPFNCHATATSLPNSKCWAEKCGTAC